MRTPKYKKEILRFFDAHHLLSLADLEKMLPEADYSTVFRNVKYLTESGTLKKITVEKNRVLYELAGHKHDHFVCDGCESVEAVHLPRPKNTKFIITEVIARGACAECNAEAA